MGALGTQHSLRPLIFWANGLCKTSGASRRGNAESYLKFDVIASEAKQSISPRKRKNGLLRRFAPRNDGLRIGCLKIESI
jgi:hypothetical protein